MIPKVIPKGFLWPPVADEESNIGKSGQIQGARMVTKPEIKAKRSSTSINLCYHT